MNAHCTLTEPSLLTHRGKGREGKGSRKGSLFPIHLPTVTVPRATGEPTMDGGFAGIGGGR